MKYSDLYSIEFIDKLNGLNPSADGIDPNEELTENFIDVKQVLGKLGFEIKLNPFMDGSGSIEGTVITVDSSEVPTRQRFTMAHELGHAVEDQRFALRKDDAGNYSAEQRKSEIFANTFASQFLMPRKLVTTIISSIISKNNWDSSCISDQQHQEIIREAASILRVSPQATGFRVNKLRVFVPISED